MKTRILFFTAMLLTLCWSSAYSYQTCSTVCRCTQRGAHCLYHRANPLCLNEYSGVHEHCDIYCCRPLA